MRRSPFGGHLPAQSHRTCSAAPLHMAAGLPSSPCLAPCMPSSAARFVRRLNRSVILPPRRLNNADLPNLRELLRSVTDEQYRRLLKGVLEHRLAFSWNIAKGGKAFDYTLLSLRRKYLNLKSLYVGTYDRATQ